MRVIYFISVVLLSLASASAKTIRIEFLDGTIDQTSIENLGRLACRNYDKIVRLKISVDWSADGLDEETTDYKRLVFWDDTAEYLFPEGSYSYLHGSYIINGYFIPRSGGMHQGIVSIAFEKIDDAQVLLNPAVEEVEAKGPDC
jgi:hypothetical protein